MRAPRPKGEGQDGPRKISGLVLTPSYSLVPALGAQSGTRIAL